MLRKSRVNLRKNFLTLVLHIDIEFNINDIDLQVTCGACMRRTTAVLYCVRVFLGVDRI